MPHPEWTLRVHTTEDRWIERHGSFQTLMNETREWDEIVESFMLIPPGKEKFQFDPDDPAKLEEAPIKLTGDEVKGARMHVLRSHEPDAPVVAIVAIQKSPDASDELLVDGIMRFATQYLRYLGEI